MSQQKQQQLAGSEHGVSPEKLTGIGQINAIDDAPNVRGSIDAHTANADTVTTPLEGLTGVATHTIGSQQTAMFDLADEAATPIQFPNGATTFIGACIRPYLGVSKKSPDDPSPEIQTSTSLFLQTFSAMQHFRSEKVIRDLGYQNEGWNPYGDNPPPTRDNDLNVQARIDQIESIQDKIVISTYDDARQFRFSLFPDIEAEVPLTTSYMLTHNEEDENPAAVFINVFLGPDGKYHPRLSPEPLPDDLFAKIKTIGLIILAGDNTVYTHPYTPQGHLAGTNHFKLRLATSSSVGLVDHSYIRQVLSEPGNKNKDERPGMYDYETE